ncbi:MAG: anti-sigma factor family protein, partial [Blastocatellia bacterium]
MGKKSKHPDKDLLDYVKGSLDQDTGRTVQKHLDSCEECSRFASLIRALRQEARTVAASVSDRELTRADESPTTVLQPDSPGRGAVARSSEIGTSFVPSPIDPYSRPGLPSNMPIAGRASNFHLDFSAHPTPEELASAFYSKPRRKTEVGTASPASEAAANVAAPVIAHIAVCSDCAGTLSAFSRGEMAAVNTDLREASQQELPAWVFKRINEWEQSAFGGQKLAENVISQGMQNRLLELSRTGGHGLHEAIEEHLIHTN